MSKQNDALVPSSLHVDFGSAVCSWAEVRCSLTKKGFVSELWTCNAHCFQTLHANFPRFACVPPSQLQTP